MTDIAARATLAQLTIPLDLTARGTLHLLTDQLTLNLHREPSEAAMNGVHQNPLTTLLPLMTTTLVTLTAIHGMTNILIEWNTEVTITGKAAHLIIHNIRRRCGIGRNLQIIITPRHHIQKDALGLFLLDMKIAMAMNIGRLMILVTIRETSDTVEAPDFLIAKAGEVMIPRGRKHLNLEIGDGVNDTKLRIPKLGVVQITNTPSRRNAHGNLLPTGKPEAATILRLALKITLLATAVVTQTKRTEKAFTTERAIRQDRSATGDQMTAT
ncbi:hypothetical protein BD410DRAFT_834002 [Rickenella mellea]|uniref:Uncharacterized protein n=1 Tax=Rickenella mellea TaxID=50990 RepID=A0A4R5XGI7_9AGAM|nr:hypothetical protein BD410DRAFT_834002 [Rickenella mellea]